MTRIFVIATSIIMSFYLTACGLHFPTRADNPQTTKIVATAQPSYVVEKKGLTKEVDVVEARTLSAEGLLRAFKINGMSVIDAVSYTSATDPNEKLGRPGEYVSKVNFNDSNFYERGESPELTIEVFENKDDMVKRRDYIQSIIEATNMNAFKYYVYDNGVFLFRIPYTVTPEVAAKYETVFNSYTGHKN